VPVACSLRYSTDTGSAKRDVHVSKSGVFCVRSGRSRSFEVIETGIPIGLHAKFIVIPSGVSTPHMREISHHLFTRIFFGKKLFNLGITLPNTVRFNNFFTFADRNYLPTKHS